MNLVYVICIISIDFLHLNKDRKGRLVNNGTGYNSALFAPSLNTKELSCEALFLFKPFKNSLFY